MRRPAASIALILFAGCIVAPNQPNAVFDAAAWETANIGQPAGFHGTGGGHEGRSGGEGSARVNLTVRPPAVMCRVASIETVTCTSEVRWNASAQSPAQGATLTVSFVNLPFKNRTCESSGTDACRLDGVVTMNQTVNTTNPYPHFVMFLRAEATDQVLGAAWGVVHSERQFEEHFTVHFSEGRPTVERAQEPISMHREDGPHA